jgi:heterodisulfide reductase subunit B
LDVVVNDVGYEEIAAQVRKPLKGLRVAPYYGCMIVRPGYGGDYDDAEQPMALDKLLRALGAEVIDFPMKAQCCGGHMTQLSQEAACKMLFALLKNATDNGADVIATLCPMCQLNLDGYQGDVNKCFGTDFQIPVLYFTQLMGVAFGKSEQELGIGKELVDARPALAKIGTERTEGDGPGKKKRLPKEALPMPKMEEV